MSQPIVLKGALPLQQQLTRLQRQWPAQVTNGCRQGMEFLVGSMKSSYLSGQRLRVRTGKLRSNWQVRELHGLGTEANRASAVGAAGATNTTYAPVHEYGFNGVQQVREYVRRTGLKKKRTRGLKSTEGKLRVRAEQRALHEHANEPRQGTSNSRRGASFRRGTWRTDPGLRRVKLLQRQAIGLQRGPEGEASSGIRAAAAQRRSATGETNTVVRRHERYMRIPAKRYARDTMRIQGQRALDIVRLAILRAVRNAG